MSERGAVCDRLMHGVDGADMRWWAVKIQFLAAEDIYTDSSVLSEVAR
jgi:hypothetical protein